MDNIFAVSDIHGHLHPLEEALEFIDLESDKENNLICCRDYIDYGPDSCGVLYTIKQLTENYPNQVIVLKGNHEFLYQVTKIIKEDILKNHSDLIKWGKSLLIHYETEAQIFVHAGIDEEAKEDWRIGTPDEYFMSKFPATLRKFHKDIGTREVTFLSMEKRQKVELYQY